MTTELSQQQMLAMVPSSSSELLTPVPSLVTFKKLTEILKCVPAASLRRWTREGKVPCLFAGGKRLYSPVHVEAALFRMASQPMKAG